MERAELIEVIGKKICTLLAPYKHPNGMELIAIKDHVRQLIESYDKSKFEDRFTQGYVCACANLVNMQGESTPATELLRCNFDSVEGLRKAGVEESDIQTLDGTIKEIERKREIKN